MNEKIFNDELYELINEVEVLLNKNAEIINENDISIEKLDETLNRLDALIVTEKMSLNEIAKTYNYFIRIGKIAVCVDPDGYTLLEIIAE